MSLGEATFVVVTANLIVQFVALWQRHQSASEARRRRLKRMRKKQEAADARQ